MYLKKFLQLGNESTNRMNKNLTNDDDLICVSNNVNNYLSYILEIYEHWRFKC